MTPQAQKTSWLVENGPKELELLFRAIVFQPSASILITDNDHHYRETIGVSKLLGLRGEKIFGRGLDDSAEPSFKHVISERRQTFFEEGNKEASTKASRKECFPLVVPDGGMREVEHIARGEVLPARNMVVMSDGSSKEGVPAWVQDYALYLLDAEGQIAAWYAGAQLSRDQNPLAQP